MATFRKVGKKWEASVCVKGQRASTTKDTKAKASSWAFEKEQELKSLGDGASLTHTLGDALEKYRDEVSPTKKTGHKETPRINFFITCDIAKIKLIDLRREDFENFIKARKIKVKYSSVNRELNILSHCMTMCRRWRWMDHNPMEDLARLKNPPPRDRRILDSEIEQLEHAINYSEDEPITLKKQCVFLAFLFAIETAMRKSEISGLLRKHVNFKKQTAFLPDTKNGTSRYVPLSKEAIRILKRLPEVEGPMFNVGASSMDTLFRKAIAKTTINNLTFHDSRHEAITRLAQKLEILDLARVTGHKDLNMLLIYYNKSAEDIAKDLD